MAVAGDHLSSPDYERRKARAEHEFIQLFYWWLERVDAEKLRASGLQHLANATVADLVARSRPNSSLASVLVGLCISYLRSQLRAYALMVGESELPPDEARAALDRHVRETLKHTYERKWQFGLRQLAPLPSLSAQLVASLWEIVEESVRDLVRDDLNVEIDDGRTLAQRRRSVSVRDKRRDLVATFKTRMAESGYKVAIKQICWAAKQKQVRQFHHWKAGKDCKQGETHGATKKDDERFSKVLKMSAPDFVQLLRERGVPISKA